MLGKEQRPHHGSTPKSVKDVDRIFRRLGLPTTNAVVGAIAGALPNDVLDSFDEAENSESSRLPIVFANPVNALWLGVGLRAPMVRAQLLWIVTQLAAHGIGPTSRVLEVGTGCGLTASTIQAILGCQVLGIDPQPGSADAGVWLNDQLGANAEYLETTPSELPPSLLGHFDAVVAQAAFTYTQPDPCRNPAPGKAMFNNALKNDSPPTADTRAVLAAGQAAGCLLVLDHDQPSLWGYVAAQARIQGLAPDWTTLETSAFLMPLGPDRQISLTFHQGDLSDEDLTCLRGIIDETDTHRSSGNLLNYPG